MRSVGREAPPPDPRAADGRLGRRGGRAPRAPSRSSSSPRRTPPTRSTGSAWRCRSDRSARATPCASAREAVGDADEVLVLSGDTPLLTTELLSSLVDAHRSIGRGGHRPLVRARRHPKLRSDRPRRDGRPRRDRRGGGRDARTSSRSTRRTRRSTSSRAEVLWPALDEPHAGERAGRALPDRCRARIVVAGGHASPSSSQPTPRRQRASTRVSSSPPRARRSATGSTASTCSPASRSSTRRRPGSSRP